ncbi:MAG: imidazole glycerol phosphate synthase subunit HisH [Epsilonproteobacteria bacterium]|nr:imidazole glycerol phosphate synthase subunit HisH [Campylobacterota bacterium]
MIAVVDYNMGNLRSVENAFQKIGEKVSIVRDPDKIAQYDKLILPGVGAFGDAMEHLKAINMDESIIAFAKSGKPLLGICLGMQLLLEDSNEFGIHKGLGLIPGSVRKFDQKEFQTPLKVPHMGWNELFVQNETPLFKGMPEMFYLYFVHSFHALCDTAYTIGKTEYGYTFPSAINKDNIYGLQPHPEKSHENGLKILQNFMEL